MTTTRELPKGVSLYPPIMSEVFVQDPKKPGEGWLEKVPDDFQWQVADPDVWFENNPPPQDFVVPGFVAGTVGGMVAAGSTGKSMHAKEMACAIAACCADDDVNGNLLELPIEKGGKVVLFAAEDPPPVLWERIWHMGAKWNRATRRAMKDRLVIVPCMAQGIDLSEKIWIDRMMHIGQGARMIILDTLTRMHSKDESLAGDAKVIMAAMERMAVETNAAVLYLHHISKLAAMSGMADVQQAARGSSVFVDNARWVSFLATMSKEEAKINEIPVEHRSAYVRWNVNKSNYFGAMSDWWYKRETGGILVPVARDIISVDENEGKSGKPGKRGDARGNHQSRRRPYA